MNCYLSPSILNSNFLDLRDNITMLNNSEADWIHLDVMDGHFVPNFTFGPPIIKMIASIAKKPLDVHLMIENPDKCLDAFIDAGASILTVHYETCPHLHRTLSHIHSMGIKAGVAINPHTPVSLLEEILPYADLILNMTVNPGFGGQNFIPSSYNKIHKLLDLIHHTSSKAIIEIDGGIELNMVESLVKKGVNAIVVGSAIFQSTNPSESIHQFKMNMKQV
jgi:ribulose-phosphate 3-epimerase